MPLGGTSSGTGFSLSNIVGTVLSGLTATFASGVGSPFSFLSGNPAGGNVGVGGGLSPVLQLLAPTGTLGTLSDTLELAGSGPNGLFNLSIPLIARTTAWLTDINGNLTLSDFLTGNVGDVLPGGLDNTITIGPGGIPTLSGSGLTGVLGDVAGAAPGPGKSLIINGATGLGLDNILKVVTNGASLPFDIVFNGNPNGGDTLTGPAITGKTTRWTVDGIGLSSLTGIVPGSGGGGPTEDTHDLSFTGVSNLIGSPGSTNAFILDTVTGITGVNGGLGSVSTLLLNDPLVTTLTQTLTGVLDGVLNLVSSTLNFLNLNQLLNLAPATDVAIYGRVNLPDVFLLTSTNVNPLLQGLGLPPLPLPNLLLVGGTGSTGPAMLFAPPTGSLLIDGRGGLDIAAVVGNIAIPGADFEIDAGVIAVLGLSTSVLGSVPALGSSLGAIQPLAPLVPLLNALALLGNIGGTVAGNPGAGVGYGGLTTTSIDTRCSSGPCAGDDGSITLKATSEGLLDELAGGLGVNFDLLPLDLATAVVLVAGAQIAGGTVEITATSTATPDPSPLPLLAANIATSIAQVLVLGSTIIAVDVPTSGNAITLAATSNVSGTTPPRSLPGVDLEVAAALFVSVAGTTVLASQLRAGRLRG